LLCDENRNFIPIVALTAFFRTQKDIDRYNTYIKKGLKVIGYTSYKTFPKPISDDSADNQTLNDTFQYTNIKTINTNITEINKKNHPDYDYIYTGICYIHNYSEFWNSLETTYNLNKFNKELSDVDAFKQMLKDDIEIKFTVLNDWYDTGNIESYTKINEIIKPKYTVLNKNFESLCFIEDRVIKFINDKTINEKRIIRGKQLFPLTPRITESSENFICMEFIQGEILSKTSKYNEIYKLLSWAKEYLWTDKNRKIENMITCKKFYIDKTRNRLNQLSFLSQEKNIINGLKCNSIYEMIDIIPDEFIVTEDFCQIHGDFILDNIIKTDKLNENQYTPLNNSIRTADEFSTKLPVTHLNIAPQRGTNSNIHR
jgi:hypothetical protein